MNILWQGARGPSVRTLQARLNELDLGPVDVDGVYGPSTEAAVVAFQRQHGVFADGMAGPQTLRLLGLSGPSPQPAPALESDADAVFELDVLDSEELELEELDAFEESDEDGAVSAGAPASRSRSAPSRGPRSPAPSRKTTVFVSYSHEDRKWLEMLQVHIAPLERMGMVDLWDDTDLAPGTRWGDAIREAIASARVAVLLISAYFMASDYIATKELPPILAAAEGEGVLILPVIISPCWMGELQQFQAVNPPDEPLVDLRRGDRDRVWVRVVEAITEALNT